ncbi:hypothetical protein [Clostridium perfringens]|uniref:hypothetical protein n=1 Tax=Clostridium perfringens TaxID=1502 RepID=UPI001C8642D0|nr:hypothetical protein [Clostridium perfringens]
MKKPKENDSHTVAGKQTTKQEVRIHEKFNSGLIGDWPPPINLDITSLGKSLILGVLGITAILVIGFIVLVKILLEHPFVISGVIFIIIICLVRTLPKDKIKALTEFIKSLPARLFP